MKYEQVEENKFLIEFKNEKETEDFLKFATDITTVRSGQVEKLGISRQLLRYYVTNGYIRTVPYGKQKRYLLEDVLKYVDSEE